MQKGRSLIVMLLGIVIIFTIGSVAFYIVESMRASAASQQNNSLQQQVLTEQLMLQHFHITNKETNKTLQSIPATPDEPGLMREFQTLALNNNVILQSAQFSLMGAGTSTNASASSTAGGSNTQLAQVQVSMTLQGSGTALLSFIHAVQYAPRLTGVTTASFTISGSNTSQLSVTLVFPYKS